MKCLPALGAESWQKGDNEIGVRKPRQRRICICTWTMGHWDTGTVRRRLSPLPRPVDILIAGFRLCLYFRSNQRPENKVWVSEYHHMLPPFHSTARRLSYSFFFAGYQSKYLWPFRNSTLGGGHLEAPNPLHDWSTNCCTEPHWAAGGRRLITGHCILAPVLISRYHHNMAMDSCAAEV
jgi:hypothetical protein